MLNLTISDAKRTKILTKFFKTQQTGVRGGGNKREVEKF